MDFTQRQVAQMVGFSAQAQSAIESGATVEPDRSNLIALARALKNDFGEKWLTQYAKEDSTGSDKQGIIESMPVEEIVTLKFGGKNSRRSKAEMQKLRDLLDAEIERMQNEE